MDLDPREKALLKQLNDNPIWVGIINKFGAETSPLRYKQGITLEDLAYTGGRVDATEVILSVLMGREVKITEDK